MPTKESIKRELDFSKNMAEILDVMKQLAQSQFTQAKKVCLSAFNGHLVTFGPVFEAMANLQGKNPFMRAENDKMAIIVATSDQAFMGALNSKLAKTARNLAGEFPREFLVTGRKGARKFKFANDPFVPFNAIKEGPDLRKLCREVTNYVIQKVKEKEFGRVYIISAFSTSFSSLEIRATQLLPLEETIPDQRLLEIQAHRSSFIMESDLSRVAEYAATLWTYHSLLYLFLNNKPAEYGALAMQMEGSHDNVKKVIGKLVIAYKRARNDKIDANMREIFVSTMVSAGG